MKAAINALGMITITAENDLESFALKHWAKEAYIRAEIIGEADSFYYRGSRLMVCELPSSSDAGETR